MQHIATARQRDDDAASKIILEQDFEEFLNSVPAGTADLILTDPPYAISRDTGFKQVKTGVKRFAVSMDFGAWDHAPIDLGRLAQAAYRALRKGGTVIIWYDLWKVSQLAQAMHAAGFKMLRQIIWEKSNPVPLNMRATYLSNAREKAVVGVKGGRPTFHESCHRGVYRHPIPRHNGRRLHPTQKPLALFSELVRVHSDPGDLVVDSFLGSGTTAVAALELGRLFWGGDIDPGYVAAARKRIAGAQTGVQLFKQGTKAALFLELARPDAEGFSRPVFVDEFAGRYERLRLGNGGSWCRDNSALGKNFHVRRHKERGRITHISLQGFNKHPIKMPVPPHIGKE